MATTKKTTKVAKKATAKKNDLQISITSADERVTIARLIDTAVTLLDSNKIYEALKQIGVTKRSVFNKLPAGILETTIATLIAEGVVNLTVAGVVYIKNGKPAKKYAVTDQKVGLGKVENFDNSAKKPAKKAAVKKAVAKKPTKPGIPAKPKKSAVAAPVVTQALAANNISLTVAELEAKINAVEGTGATPRLVVIRRPTDAIMASIGVQNSVYTDTTRPASPSRTLVALNARLGALNLRSTEWYVRDLF